jgi:NAD-dependent dihydropyrimidine dehydrogenase PreA subunit
MISRVNVENFNRTIGSREGERFLTIESLAEMDPLMKIRMRLQDGDGGTKVITLRAKDAVGVYTDKDLLGIEEMAVKDAAELCPLCGHCEPPCPVDLPIRIYIRDLKIDGSFGGGD